MLLSKNVQNQPVTVGEQHAVVIDRLLPVNVCPLLTL